MVLLRHVSKVTPGEETNEKQTAHKQTLYKSPSGTHYKHVSPAPAHMKECLKCTPSETIYLKGT